MALVTFAVQQDLTNPRQIVGEIFGTGDEIATMLYVFCQERKEFQEIFKRIVVLNEMPEEERKILLTQAGQAKIIPG